VSLYKVLDVVKGSVGGEKALEAKQWVPARELKRLTLTANAVETARSGGRHAYPTYSLTNAKLDPMPLADAWEVIRRVVRAWLLTKP
jgi:hypothetical protein